MAGAQIKEAARFLNVCQRAVILTGAGVSAASGIPCFRGKGGLWERFAPEEVASLASFMRNPAKFWDFMKKMLARKPAPNQAHLAIAGLEEEGCIQAVITQNIDGLHQIAGSKKVVELHGSSAYSDCLDCGQVFLLSDLLLMLDRGYPSCSDCGSRFIKPRIVLFGENIPVLALKEAEELVETADCFLVVGSSLQVYPAANLPLLAAGPDKKLVLINTEPTAKDYIFDLVIYGRSAEVLPQLAKEWKALRKKEEFSC